MIKNFQKLSTIFKYFFTLSLTVKFTIHTEMANYRSLQQSQIIRKIVCIVNCSTKLIFLAMN